VGRWYRRSSAEILGDDLIGNFARLVHKLLHIDMASG